MKTIRRELLSLICALSATTDAHSQSSEFAKDDVCAFLARAEELLENAYCEYVHRVIPAAPEQINQIRKIHGEDAESFIITPDDAHLRFEVVRMWTKGAKLRYEIKGKEHKHLVSAFDGQIVRTLDQSQSEQLMASLMTIKTGHWYSIPDHHVLYLMSKYYKRSLSEIISTSTDYSRKVVRTQPQRAKGHVSVDCGGSLAGHVLEFVFDEDMTMHTKWVKHRRPEGLVPNGKYEFSDYRLVKGKSGQELRFPHRVVYIGYSGKLSSGEALDVRREEFEIALIRFTDDIPDSMFELEIPLNALINDGITGLGWYQPGKKPITESPPLEDGTVFRRWLTAAVMLAAMLFVAALLWLQRKRARRLRSSNGDEP